MQAKRDRDAMAQDFIAAAEWLGTHELSTGKVGAIGFCFGGGMVNRLVSEIPDVIDAGAPAFKQALKKNDVTFESHVDPGVNHGFHNDTTPRHDEAAAKLAWERTIAWLKKHLA